MRLRSHLVILALSAALPLLILSFAIVRQDSANQRAVLDQGMRNTVRALSLAVDGEVKASLAVLDTLAASAYLDTGDLKPFYDLCTKTVEGRKNEHIILFDRSGQQVLNSSRPFGSPLPNPLRAARPAGTDPGYPDAPLGGAKPVEKVLETGRPVVSDLFVSLVTKRPRISLDVPVVRSGSLRYVLELSLDPVVFTELLANHHLPSDSVANVLDRRGLVIARTLDQANSLGRPLGADLAARIATSDEASYTHHTVEGMPVYHVFTRSKSTGWTTSVAVSRDVVGGPVRRSITLLLGGVAIAMVLAGSLAFFLGRRIATPISILAGAAAQLARGDRVDLTASAVREVKELHDSLVTAGGSVRQREAKIRRLVDANIIGVIIADLDGSIIEANDAFLEMLGYSRDDLVAGRLQWPALTPAEWHAATQRAIAQILATGRCDSYEQECIRKGGSRVPTLVAGAAFEGTRSQSVSFVLDLSERKRAEEGLQRAHAELAHVTRVMTVGELTASIAHEVTQPLAAIVTNGDACLRLLGSDEPNLGETRKAVTSIIRDATRAAEVVARVRALLKKSDSDRTALDLGQLIREVLCLIEPEVARHRIVLQTSLADDLRPVLGDRIQLQQVALNLLTNAIEAMGDVADRRRELVISARRHDVDPDAGVLVAVQDAGVGFEWANVDQLFEALYTTKPDGLGMGLSISRSIVLSHGGRLWATPNAGNGATFQFVLPAWKGQSP